MSDVNRQKLRERKKFRIRIISLKELQKRAEQLIKLIEELLRINSAIKLQKKLFWEPN